MPRSTVQFCPKGHDTKELGRASRSACSECQREYWRNPGRKESHRVWSANQNWRRAGIKNDCGEQFTSLDYDRLYQIQAGRCFLCKRHSTEFKRNLAVDHDHETGKVRSLICCPCNQTIVGANTIETAERLIEYLRDHASL